MRSSLPLSSRSGGRVRNPGDDKPMAKSPGIVKCELLREADSSTRYQLVFRFENADAAVGWRTSEVHKALQPALQVLHVDMAVQGYEVIG